MNFAEPNVLHALETARAEELDGLSFGIIGLAPTGEVEVYNETEAQLAGLGRTSVLGRHFFTAVAPCMNNFMVAQRFEDEAALDETIDYVLTFRMRPKRVKLRLLKAPQAKHHYILVQQ